VIFLNNTAFFFQGISVLLPEDKTAATKSPEIPLAYTNNFPQAELFTIPVPGGTIYGVDISLETILPPHWKAIPVRQFVSLFPASMTDRANSPSFQGEIARLLQAFHIAQWRRESVFCGSCGCKNTDAGPSSGANTEKYGEIPIGPARLCPSCGRIEFPRIAPAVIVLITNDEDKILLAHNKKFTPGVYSLIAGFVDAGENLEEAAIREIHEEVNIDVRDLRYISSQPWPFPNSLMAGFSAQHASGSILVDDVEIEDAQWFSRDNLPKLPGSGSVSRYLIDQWKDNEQIAVNNEQSKRNR
jgi:NAD+ diphosphatase